VISLIRNVTRYEEISLDSRICTETDERRGILEPNVDQGRSFKVVNC